MIPVPGFDVARSPSGSWVRIPRFPHMALQGNRLGLGLRSWGLGTSNANAPRVFGPQQFSEMPDDNRQITCCSIVIAEYLRTAQSVSAADPLADPVRSGPAVDTRIGSADPPHHLKPAAPPPSETDSVRLCASIRIFLALPASEWCARCCQISAGSGVAHDHDLRRHDVERIESVGVEPVQGPVVQGIAVGVVAQVN